MYLIVSVSDLDAAAWASSNNKVCDFRKPLALADGLKLELATLACHTLGQAMSSGKVFSFRITTRGGSSSASTR